MYTEIYMNRAPLVNKAPYFFTFQITIPIIKKSVPSVVVFSGEALRKVNWNYNLPLRSMLFRSLTISMAYSCKLKFKRTFYVNMVDDQNIETNDRYLMPSFSMTYTLTYSHAS